MTKILKTRLMVTHYDRNTRRHIEGEVFSENFTGRIKYVADDVYFEIKVEKVNMLYYLTFGLFYDKYYYNLYWVPDDDFYDHNIYQLVIVDCA
jgi:hypothetical protein